MSKLVASIKEAIEKCELRDGMTISFHHHMRNGDYVLNMVLDPLLIFGLNLGTAGAAIATAISQKSDRQRKLNL